MIYTVTLNPTLDITYVLEDLRLDTGNMAKEVIKSPGGKGINVSRALHNMGEESVTLGLIGGFTGIEVKSLLELEGLNLKLVKIANQTRTNIVILNERDGSELNISTLGPAVETPETEALVDMIYQTAKAPGYMVVSGSIPPQIDVEIYKHLILKGKERGLATVLDSSGKPLRAGIAAGPDLIKPNRKELENLIGREITSDLDVVAASKEVLEYGVGMVAVSLGRAGAILTNKEAVLKGTGPLIEGKETIGAGDSMVAGMIIAMLNGDGMEEILRMGLACGTSAVMISGPELCEPETVNQFLPQITIEEIQ